MSKHLLRDLEIVKRDLLAMGSMIEGAVNKAITALIARRPRLAQDVIQGDNAIDLQEIAIDDDCLKLLALHQPVANDLRFVVAVMKVNNDLERMGDLAVNMAERALYLSTHEPIEVPGDFARMVDSVQAMLRKSLASLVNLDAQAARLVCEQDSEVDAIHRAMFVQLQLLMVRDSTTVKRAVQMLSVSRYLERIADLATNIAEDVVFMVEGEVIRHRFGE